MSIGLLWIGFTFGACFGALVMGVLTGSREPVEGQ